MAMEEARRIKALEARLVELEARLDATDDWLDRFELRLGEIDPDHELRAEVAALMPAGKPPKKPAEKDAA